MREPQAYFSSFISEMSDYSTQLRVMTQFIASPTRSGAGANDALLSIHRLAHTISGLAQTLAIADFTVMSSALAATSEALSQAAVQQPHLLTIPMTRMVAHCDARLYMMRQENTFMSPTTAEMAEAEHIAATIWALAPTIAPAIPMTVTAATSMPEIDLIDEEWNPAIFDEDDDDLLTTGQPLTAEAQAIINAFLAADLNAAVVPQNEPVPTLTFQPETTTFDIPLETMTTFITEISDGVPEMRQALLVAQQVDDINQPLRVLAGVVHRLKGAAFMLELAQIGNICMMQEVVLRLIRQQQLYLDQQVVHWFISSIDGIDRLRSDVANQSQSDITNTIVENLHNEYRQLQPISSLPVPPTKPRTNIPGEPERTPTTITRAAIHPRNLVRIKLEAVDGLMANFNSVLLHRIDLRKYHSQSLQSQNELRGVIARLATLYDGLRTERAAALLTTTLGDQHDGREMIMGGNAAQARLPHQLAYLTDHRKHSTELQRSEQPETERFTEFDMLMSMVGEVINDLSGLDLSLQTALNHSHRDEDQNDTLMKMIERDLLKLRMMPLSETVQRLEWVANRAALHEGKVIQFITTGDDMEIDRDLSELLIEPLELLVINAIVHGIETGEDRQANGKVDPATVHLQFASDNDEIIITVADNGSGVNYAELVAAANVVARLNNSAIVYDTNMSREDILELMFLPDVSTRSGNSDVIAGRGMGLYSVKQALEMMRGTITVDSTPGMGTTFQLRVPATLSVMRAFIVSVGDNGYVLPIRAIEQTANVSLETRHQDAHGVWQIEARDSLHGNAYYPLLYLSDLIGHESIGKKGSDVLLVRAHDQTFAVCVDKIIGADDVVVRKVPSHLQQRGVRGATITKEGTVQLILDLPELISRAMAVGRLQTPPVDKLPEQGNYILVVDDSPTIRQTLQTNLTEAGYTVKVAANGLEALNQILRLKPQLLLLDVEMPELNGYSVLDILQRHEPFHDLRAIMLTSRAGARHKEYAQRLGALAYLVKPCTIETLLAAVHDALQVPTE